MKEVKMLAWDNGFDFDKFIAGEKRVIFPSVIYKSENIKKNGFTMGKQNYKKDNMCIYMDNDKYFIGDKAIQQSPDGGSRNLTDDKFKNKTEIIKLLAGVKLLFNDISDNNIHIKNLQLGLSIKTYYKYKKDLINKFSEKVFDFRTSSDEKFKISIDNVTCIPQGIGSYYDLLLDINGKPVEPELLNQRYGLIDIGGKTVDTFTADGTDPIEDSITHLDKGMTDGFKQASNMISNDIPFNLVEEEYIQGKEKIYYNEYHDLVKPCETAFSNLADEIFNEIYNTWNRYLPRIEKIYLVGGGAKFLHDYFVEKFDKDIKLVDDPQFSNVRGYYKIGMYRLSR